MHSAGAKSWGIWPLPGLLPSSVVHKDLPVEGGLIQRALETWVCSTMSWGRNTG